MRPKAKIIADSINKNNQRITTFEVEYWKAIHPEMLTHRVFSRNTSSSRAIPTTKMLEQVRENPASPSHWGKNKAGMQSDGQLAGSELQQAKDLWSIGAKDAADLAERMLTTNGHKEWINRVVEPYLSTKIVITSTDYENFFWLRDHNDAQPEIKELARLMRCLLDMNKPQTLLSDNFWHLPYVETKIISNQQYCFDEDSEPITLEQAIKISCSSCAQVSYRKLDKSLEKADDLYNRLVKSEPVHASAFEHVACTISGIKNGQEWPEGVTHIDRNNNWYSGNFRDWVQYRQLIPYNSKLYA